MTQQICSIIDLKLRKLEFQVRGHMQPKLNLNVGNQLDINLESAKSLPKTEYCHPPLNI